MRHLLFLFILVFPFRMVAFSQPFQISQYKINTTSFTNNFSQKRDNNKGLYTKWKEINLDSVNTIEIVFTDLNGVRIQDPENYSYRSQYLMSNFLVNGELLMRRDIRENKSLSKIFKKDNEAFFYFKKSRRGLLMRRLSPLVFFSGGIIEFCFLKKVKPFGLLSLGSLGGAILIHHFGLKKSFNNIQKACLIYSNKYSRTSLGYTGYGHQTIVLENKYQYFLSKKEEKLQY